MTETSRSRSARAGSLQGVVTIAAIEVRRSGSLVEASWGQDGQPCSDSVEVGGFEQARAVVLEAADQLVAGTRPGLTREA